MDLRETHALYLSAYIISRVLFHEQGRPKNKYRIMNNTRKCIHFIMTVMKWLELYFLQSGQISFAEKLVERYFVIRKTRGKKEAIKFCKESRSSIYRWLATIDSLDHSVRLHSRVGLPKRLRFLKHVKNLSYPFIRLILSSLYVSRSETLPTSMSFDSIVQPPSKEYPVTVECHIQDFWKTLGYTRKGMPQSVYWKRFHLSTKAGPNGQALWSALADLGTLPDSLVESIGVVGGAKLKSLMSLLLIPKYFTIVSSFFKVRGGRFRRVSVIPSTEGKTREVAILDYWSQTALLALHQYLFRVLRKINQDCTFNQGSFKDKVSTETRCRFHSIDLTRFTDRFPVRLVKAVLKGRFDDSYVEHWHNIMVGYPFDSSGGAISYAVGTPMGAYTSWNSTTLAHHYVMFYCCKELKIEFREAPYVILGDDVVIRHDDLAKMYMEVISSLGVGISVDKSHISNNFYEFAKRTFHQGNEVTPFPISALWSTRRTPSLMLNVITNEAVKGWVSPSGIPAVSSELYRLLGFNATYVAKKRMIFYISFAVMQGIRGITTAEQAIRSVLVEYYPDVEEYFKLLDHDVASLVMTRWYMKMFSESFLRSVDPKRNQKPLGDIACELVMLLSGNDETAIAAFDLVETIPMLQIHGQMEEVYLSVIKGGEDQLNKALSHDWKSVLRALTIPVSDQIYVSRNQDLLVHSSFVMAKILRSIIEKTRSHVDLLAILTEEYNKPFVFK